MDDPWLTPLSSEGRWFVRCEDMEGLRLSDRGTDRPSSDGGAAGGRAGAEGTSLGLTVRSQTLLLHLPSFPFSLF